tara:strand:- start:352 stop:636 length:285 start_codon:yes stop_codon:yes gene_type:complete
MGIKKLKVEKKKLPKLLPSLSVKDEPKRIKLSKKEEQLYKQYSDINESISAQRISEDDVNQNIQFRVQIPSTLDVSTPSYLRNKNNSSKPSLVR